MNFQGIRLRALLIPLGVALFPVGVLLWYGFLQIPAQEAYLTERNFRLLTTLSSAVRAKIESYDGALDHAVASFQNKTLDQLRDGVHLFAKDLDVVKVVKVDKTNAAAVAKHEDTPPDDIESQLLPEAADPPRVTVVSDEGRYYLYLAADPQENGHTIRVVAKSDLEAVVAPLLVDTTEEFAAILLTTDTGLVIAQHAPLGLSLAQLDAVVDVKRTPSPAKDTTPPAKFTDLTTFSNVVPVSIGEVDYKLYMQPLPLSLLSRKNAGTGGREPERWVLCGLVRADRFKADSSALSYPTLLWFSGFLAAFGLALPFVKLRGLSPRERLRASDVRWLNTSAFLLVALLTFAALDVLAFWNQFAPAVDTRLTDIATVLSKSLNDEVIRIDKQASAFETDSDPTVKPITTVFPDVSAALGSRPFPLIIPGRPVTCDLPDACRSELVDEPWFHATDRYPFFSLVTWAGEDGWQRVRYTPGMTFRPFLNIFDDKLRFGEEARAAWAMPQLAPTQGVEVESSPNTGEPLTVFWRTGEAKHGHDDVKWVQALAISSLVSLDRPALPNGVSFAVVDPQGLVLFHSISGRQLRENFLKESEDDAALSTLVRTGASDHVSATYQGRSARFFVKPLLEDFRKTSGEKTFEDPKWRLVVFQDDAIVDTVNLETLTIACLLFTGYACVLALTALTIYGFSARSPGRWFWPDPQKPSTYRSVLILNLRAILAFAALFLIGTSRPWLRGVLLAVTLIGAVATAVATYWMVTRAKPEPRDTRAFRFLHPFFLARAAFLAVIAGLPAIACFQTAYAFEATLLASSESAQHAKEPTPEDRSLKAFQSMHLDARFAQSFVESRAAFVSKIDAALWQKSETDGNAQAPAEYTDAAPGVLDHRLLLWLHRSYNEIANDLGANADKPTAQVPPPSLRYVSILPFIGGLCALCFAIVYWLGKPMFALDARAPRTSVAEAAKHILLVGPPGSGKSTKLATDPDIRIFDVATQAWVERRRKAVPVPKERRRLAVVGAVAAGSGSVTWEPFRSEAIGSTPHVPTPSAPATGGWAGAFEHDTLPAALAIDHVDFRLGEREFAAQTLTFVERAVYRDTGSVRIVSDRDPLMCLRESDAPAAEIDRWVRVLRRFRTEWVSIDKVAPVASDASESAYYESLWNACSLDERLVLRQLAEEGVVNPQNQIVVGDLLQAGLVVRAPALQIMNDSFRDFVLQAATPAQVSAWERRGVVIPWSTIEVAMLTVVVTLAGLLIVTQEQLLNAWIGFIPAFLPAAQKLVKAVAGLRLPPDGSVST